MLENSEESEFIVLTDSESSEGQDQDQHEQIKLAPNKVLVVMATKNDNVKDNILKKIFKVEAGNSIYKSLTWKNKYYSVDYDLYVDDCESLIQWLDEVNSDEYTELRELLTGIIMIQDFAQDDKKFNANLKELIDNCPQDIVVAGIHIGKPVDVVKKNIDYSVSNLNFELCNVNDTIGEDNEKTGLDRVIEIMDTHSWPGCNMKLSQQEDHQQSRKEADLEHLIHKLQEAKLHYEHLVRDADADQDEALDYAQQIAEEIAREL